MQNAEAVRRDPEFMRKLVRVAWMSIALGLALEIAIFLLNVDGVKGVAGFAADCAQRVSWSLFVCCGLALGTAAVNSLPRAMGIAGLVSGPIGFGVARVAHKSAVQALGLVVAEPTAVSPWVIVAIKSVQYAVLGIWLGRLAMRSNARFSSHVVAGAVCGLLFGALLVWLLFQNGAPSTSVVVARSFNELIFPVGCASVIYAASHLPTQAPR